MNATTAPDNKLDQAINHAFSRLRDVSLRDGVQSWDGNRPPIDELLPIAHELNALVKLGKKRGIAMPSAEVWGGGQVAQPAMFMGEDPLCNLEDLKKAMPDTDIMALFRGRQCLGFKPVSAEIQEKAIEASAIRGVKVFRVFDMMNDPENIKPGIDAMMAYKKKHGPDSIVIEGAISYISPPDKDGKFSKGKRAMTLSEYGDYAVQLAHMGVDEITIKNYAGVGDKEMPDLIRTIRTKLEHAGHPTMKINLHDHGQKPETVNAALDAGADKVDVAIGSLSGGPSHTNMRSAINHILETQGIDVSQPATQRAINHHPMMQQLARVEAAIETMVTKERPGKNGQMTTFKKDRAVLESITQEEADHYRIAGGAFSAVLNNIDTLYAKYGKDGAPKGFPPKDMYFRQILEKSGNELWEKGGQFNTVTPGAKNLTDAGHHLINEEVNGQPITLDKYKTDYVDIAVGRYGKNRGMEKGLGDTKWHDTMLMYRGLQEINKGLAEGKMTEAQLGLFTFDANMGREQQQRPIVKTKNGKKQFDLKDPQLEAKLNMSDIVAFREAIEKSQIDAELKACVLAASTPGRSPDPVEGLEVGKAKVEQLKSDGVDVAALHESGHRISSPEDVALLSMLLPENAFSKMIDTAKRSTPVAKVGGESRTAFTPLDHASRRTGDSANLH